MILASFQNLAKNYPPPFCWFERDTLRRSAGWIAFGRTVFETLRDRPAYAQRPWRIITPGVDTDVFHPDAHQRRSVRRRLQWDESGPPVVGFLGRFLPEKGLGLLMSVLAAQQSPWRALFVGAGPMESKLRGWATSFGDNVRICCDVRHADVPAYLNAMDMLCAPSQTLPRCHSWAATPAKSPTSWAALASFWAKRTRPHGNQPWPGCSTIAHAAAP